MSTIIERLRAFARRWHGAVADPCTCKTPAPYVIVDANSHRSWCSTCGGRLWGMR
jgi:hypothetical protein